MIVNIVRFYIQGHKGFRTSLILSAAITPKKYFMFDFPPQNQSKLVNFTTGNHCSSDRRQSDSMQMNSNLTAVTIQCYNGPSIQFKIGNHCTT